MARIEKHLAYSSVRLGLVLAVLAPIAAGCGDDVAAKDAGNPDSGTSVVPDAGPLSCQPLKGDYAPGASDAWSKCSFDDGTYHKIMATIGSAARVQAFEDMAELLFTPKVDPSVDDFKNAYLKYIGAGGGEEQSIESRIKRRYDPHFGVSPDEDPVNGIDCHDVITTDANPAVAENPDYCVGAGILKPIVDAAFEAAADAADTDPRRLHAARIEGALLWLFYASAYKESESCTDTPEDCDSSWAYGNGAKDKGKEIGLAGRIRALDPETADRIWNGNLAVGCWREIDKTGAELNLTYDSIDRNLRDKSRDQADRALLDGVALVVSDTLSQAKTASGDVANYHIAMVQVLGRALYRQMGEDSPTDEATLKAALDAKAPTDTQLDAAIAAIDNVFPISCTAN